MEVVGERSQRPRDSNPFVPTAVRASSGEHSTNPRFNRALSDKTIDHLQRRTKATDELHAEKNKLGQWLSTGLCGNNITSSALYVVAICSVPAGKYAPIALLCIAVLLYLFRGIYEEVVMALPVNGGTYNLLLNTTSKSKASIAACLTMLSYVTTAVISATSAMRYVHSLCEPTACAVLGADSESSIIVSTLVTIALAAILNLCGITESALVAFLIFAMHMSTTGLLIILSLVRAVVDMPTVTFDPMAGSMLTSNASVAAVDASSAAVVQMGVLEYNWAHTEPSTSGGIFGAIFFGYCSALLGISGFESSSCVCWPSRDLKGPLLD